MTKHKFGGDWTSDKLERVRKYLCAYTTIFARNAGARYFTTIYVDAFAGSGHRVDAVRTDAGADLFEAEADSDTEAYKKGSARIALEVRPTFDQYVFIEGNAARAAELRQLVAELAPDPRAAQVYQRDSNEFLREWSKSTDWRSHRAVVFLDPYGMQVDWSTMEALARTAAVDVWVLFPLGMAVNRLLTRDGLPPPEWGAALARFLGTEDWRTTFYRKREQDTLFGEDLREVKAATWESIGKFFVSRLQSVFTEVHTDPLPLCNSHGTPIYLLCFAAGNPRGAPTALKIANHILNR